MQLSISKVEHFERADKEEQESHICGRRTPLTLEAVTRNKSATAFRNIFRTASSATLLDFFAVFRKYDYTEAELVRKTGLTPKTVSKELENLVDKRILRRTRKVGRSNMYGLNNSPEATKLLEYTDAVIKNAYKRLGTANSKR